LLAGTLLGGCTSGKVGEALLPEPITVTVEAAPQALSATASFADERGGGLFIDLAGRTLRLRDDGSEGALASHPQNPEPPGPATSAWPLGHAASLVATSRGLYVAEDGWLIAPAWRTVLPAAGLVATSVGRDGVGWLAHGQGLYRLAGGVLSELQVEGASVTGLTALATGPTPDGNQGVWFAQGETLTAAGQSSVKAFTVMDSGLTAAQLKGGVLALAGLDPFGDSPGEVWAITPHALLQYTAGGWRTYTLSQSPTQLRAAGRVAWLVAGDGLYRYDADASRWTEAKGLASAPTLLAVDAAGCAWVRVGAQTLRVSADVPVRLEGLFDGDTVYASELSLQLRVPTAAPVTAGTYALDTQDARVIDVTQAVAGTGPEANLTFLSLAGNEATGAVRPVSLASLKPGDHTLALKVTDAAGVHTRAVHFTTQTEGAAVSWALDMKPISDSRCAKCHATGTMPVLSTYAQWKTNAAAIASAVSQGRMPGDGALDQAGKALVQRWVNGGMQP
jgi:hypothetical protein